MRWNDMRLLDMDIPAGFVARGEKLRLVMPRRYQFDWLKQMNAAAGNVWLQSDDGNIAGSSAAFSGRVSCLLYQRGALANLTLRENILLPFLYAGQDADIVRATEELPGIAVRLDIADKLDEQAGERSGFMHGLIALARVMLMHPDFIVVQDAHAGMQPHRQEAFRSLFCAVVEELGAGVLYLSASSHDGSGLDFCQSLEFAGVEENL